MNLKEHKGITLIVLVVTIIVLLILSGITINMVIGENGILTKAQETAKKTNEIEANTQSYLNEMQKELGEELTNANIQIYPDKTESNVERVVITVEGTIKEDEIIGIECPDGSTIQGNIATYEVNKNGEYSFWIKTKNGRQISRSIQIANIKGEGIDLTGLVTGENPGHNHIFTKKFDNNNHYEECIVCGLKRNIVAHKITRKIAMENIPVCYQSNYYIDSCECGYYTIGHIQHTYDEQKLYTEIETMKHHTICKLCTDWPINENCIKADGTIITCNNLGTCIKCGYNYNVQEHKTILANSENCVACGKRLIQVIENSYSYNEQMNQYTFIYKFKIVDPNVHIIDNSGITWQERCGFKTISIKNSIENGIETVIAIMEPVKRFQGKLLFVGNIGYTYGTNGRESRIMYDKLIVPETAKSEIQDVKVLDVGQSQGWTKQKQITVKGMDNWSNNVKISMLDSRGKTIYDEVIVLVNNNNYEYTFIPKLEAGKQGETYTIKVKDVFENSKTKNITISNIDYKAPQLASNTSYIEGWSRTKEITIRATDEGIGNVQIAFNNENDYQLGNLSNGIYTRKYIFTGDAYEGVQGGIYLKDGLENKQMSTIKIGKIDNTSPTITNVQTRKEGANTIIVTISANDINAKLNQEGSGIAGYAITKTKQLPEERMYQANNEIQIQEQGIYYVYVKDNVGNISARYVLEVK